MVRLHPPEPEAISPRLAGRSRETAPRWRNCLLRRAAEPARPVRQKSPPAPTNADIPEITTIFVEKQDRLINPTGVKGLAELPTVGVAAAIAKAVYHATGVRMRDLPILPEKMLV